MFCSLHSTISSVNAASRASVYYMRSSVKSPYGENDLNAPPRKTLRRASARCDVVRWSRDGVTRARCVVDRARIRAAERVSMFVFTCSFVCLRRASSADTADPRGTSRGRSAILMVRSVPTKSPRDTGKYRELDESGRERAKGLETDADAMDDRVRHLHPRWSHSCE